MGFVRLTDEIIEELRRIRDDTGVGPMAFLRQRSDVPRGLNSSVIGSWVTGKAKRAREQHLRYVLKHWPLVTPVIAITSKIRGELDRELDRTGVAPGALMTLIMNCPDRLSADKISRWRKGYTKSARKDHLDAVLNTLRELPDAEPEQKHVYEGRTPHHKRRVFSEADGLALEAERARTGVQASELLKYFYRGQVPEGLSASMISVWINNKPRTVPADLYEWTLRAWKALPDAEK